MGRVIDEKKIKAEFKSRASKDPERYYPVQVLIDDGFERRICRNCGTAFWSREPRKVCGEPDCSGGYSFIGDTPAKKKMDFIETWQEFSKLFKRLEYTPIKRYPVVARWRDDADFVQASIYDFQPYVVSGEIEPPANPLVVPQFCLRFNDIDNVGFTGRHYTGFVMIGQHAFEPPERYAPPDYLRDIYTWLVEGMGLPRDEVQFHEDAWAGGGNMGPSMEFFSRGLEIGNQVYMQYDIHSGAPKELSIKVLDMGMGQERPAWFTHGTATSYEANFGGAIRKLYRATGIRPDPEVVEKFLPYSGMLNFDEAEDIDRVWRYISKEIDVELGTLRDVVIPLASLYSVADHSRSLLVALTDGALPSNVGGGYNLRTLLRRALDIISSNAWDVGLIDVCSWHADYLRPQYPELKENLDEIGEILAVEERRHQETKRKSKRIVSTIKGKISIDRLITLYDSQGITPQMIAEAGQAVEVPADFYSIVSERHGKIDARASTKKELVLPLDGLLGTEILYYSDYLRLEFAAKVMKVIDNKYVVLDRTAFYPTSGGQLHDLGTINRCEVTDTFKQGNIVVHVVPSPDFKAGDLVTGRIEKDRRMQLAQHHTATHIINGVARELLGGHIWQAGAEKTLEKARLDITHYETLSDSNMNEVESRANEVVSKGLPVESVILKRDKAESEYGFRLYQGGAVPGKELRIVKIGDLDVEACGGTHLHNTSEVGVVKLTGTTKIQDGIVRLEYTAGNAAREYIKNDILKRASIVIRDFIDSSLPLSFTPQLENLGKEIHETLQRVEKGEGLQESMDRVQEIDAELRACARVFSIHTSQLHRTIQRFMKEVEGTQKQIVEMGGRNGRIKLDIESGRGQILKEVCTALFKLWKDEKKSLEQLKKERAGPHLDTTELEKAGPYRVLIKEIDAGSRETLKFAKGLAGEDRVIVIFGVEKGISVVGLRGRADLHMGELVRDVSKMLGGSGGGRPDFGQGAGNDTSKIREAMEFARTSIIKAVEKEI